MKVIIAGSRSITGALADRLVREALLASDWWAKVTEVVSGHCEGIDLAGERWADLAGVRKKLVPADWKRHGKKAGPLRNGQMALYADALVAVGYYAGRGTADMVRQMEALEKPVFYYKGD